jgi:hypothetical protein
VAALLGNVAMAATWTALAVVLVREHRCQRAR